MHQEDSIHLYHAVLDVLGSVCLSYSELIEKLKLAYRTVKTYSYHFRTDSFLIFPVFTMTIRSSLLLFSNLFWPFSPVSKKYYCIFCDFPFSWVSSYSSILFSIFMWAYFSYLYLKHLHFLCWPHHLSITFAPSWSYFNGIHGFSIQLHAWFLTKNTASKLKNHSLATSWKYYLDFLQEIWAPHVLKMFQSFFHLKIYFSTELFL